VQPLKRLGVIEIAPEVERTYGVQIFPLPSDSLGNFQ
jgi:hypothetical protein